MSDEAAFFLAWLCAGTATLVSTVRWLVRFRRNDVWGAVVSTALAGAPGVAMLVQHIYAAFEVGMSNAIESVGYGLTAAIAGLWIAGGPICLLVGFVWRAIVTEDVPSGTALVQTLHVVIWVWASLISLLSLVSVL